MAVNYFRRGEMNRMPTSDLSEFAGYARSPCSSTLDVPVDLEWKDAANKQKTDRFH